MKVPEYADQYGLSLRTVYHAIYAGRLSGRRGPAGWDLDDIPLAISDRWRVPDELLALPDYVLALLWYNATISGDAILIRNTDPYAPLTVAKYLRGSVWQSARNAMTATWVFKAQSPALSGALRELGFSGRTDPDRMPPPVDPVRAAQALMETHGAMGRQLQYPWRHPKDKRFARYIPKFGVSGAAAIIQVYADTLHAMGIIPVRKLCPAANGTTRELHFTAQPQLHSIYNAFAGLTPGNSDFWIRYLAHISQPPIPYNSCDLH